MHNAQEGLVGQRRPLGHAKDAMVLVGPGQDVAADIQPPTADLPDRLGAVQVFPALAQLLFRLLALGDVSEKGVVVFWFALGIPRQVNQQFDGHAPAIFPEVFLLIPDRLAGAVEFLQLLPLDLPPFGWGERRGPVEGAEFRAAVAGQLLEGPVDEPETAIRIPDAESLGGVLEDAGQQLVLPPGFPQREFLFVGRRLEPGATVEFGHKAHEQAHAGEEPQANGIHEPLDSEPARGQDPISASTAAVAVATRPGPRPASRATTITAG